MSVCLEPAVFEHNTVPWGRLIADDGSNLELPGIVGDTVQVRRYAATVQGIIHRAQERLPLSPCGWIADLRRKGEGNTWHFAPFHLPSIWTDEDRGHPCSRV